MHLSRACDVRSHLQRRTRALLILLSFRVVLRLLLCWRVRRANGHFVLRCVRRSTVRSPSFFSQSCVLLRALFFPAFLLCLYGPAAMGAEWVVFSLTAMLGATNGYFTG